MLPQPWQTNTPGTYVFQAACRESQRVNKRRSASSSLKTVSRGWWHLFPKARRGRSTVFRYHVARLTWVGSSISWESLREADGSQGTHEATDQRGLSGTSHLKVRLCASCFTCVISFKANSPAAAQTHGSLGKKQVCSETWQRASWSSQNYCSGFWSTAVQFIYLVRTMQTNSLTCSALWRPAVYLSWHLGG